MGVTLIETEPSAGRWLLWLLVIGMGFAIAGLWRPALARVASIAILILWVPHGTWGR